MIMKTFLLLFPLLVLILFGCQPEENFPKATTSGGSGSTLSVVNGITLAPTGWVFLVGNAGNQSNPNNYRQTFNTSSSGTTSPGSGTGLVGVSSRSTSYTLGMTASAISDTASHCSWAYSLYPPTSLRVGKTLTLKAKVQLTNVQGQGVSLVIRGDKGAKTSVLFATTQGKIPIQGNAEFAEYSVSLPYTQAVDLCILYVVMLPNTTGTVSVTDMVLSIN